MDDEKGVNNLEKMKCIHLLENNHDVERTSGENISNKRGGGAEKGGGHLAEHKGKFQRQPSRLHDGDQNGKETLVWVFTCIFVVSK